MFVPLNICIGGSGVGGNSKASIGGGGVGGNSKASIGGDGVGGNRKPVLVEVE